MKDNKFLYLVKVEPNANNNKFYKMIQLNENNFSVEYGRIGNDNFQTTNYNISQWDKKFNEKIKKGYINESHLVAETIVKQKKKEYNDISNVVISSIVARLQAMARQAIADNYTISSNKVTKTMIEEAQITLNNLMEADNIELFNKILVDLFKIIPRKMKKVKDNLASKKEDFATIIQKEQDLLDVMKGQVIQESIVSEEVVEDSPIYNQTILEAMGLKFEEINEDEKQLIKRNLGSASNKFYQAWKVVNIKTQEKFDKFIIDNKIKNNKLLWHGSKNENFWSIINLGLSLRPNATITGKLYGHGIYFAPKAEKSLGYSSLNGSYWARGNSNSGFMALFEVAYGKPYDVYDFDSKYYNLNYDSLQKMSPNSNSLHAHAGASLGYSTLRNDEIVIYKEEQCTIKYLVELR